MKSDGIEFQFRNDHKHESRVVFPLRLQQLRLLFTRLRRGHKEKIEDAPKGDSIKRGTTRKYANSHH